LKIDPAITARALRTPFHEQTSQRPEGDAVTPRPPLAFDDDDGTATAAWLGQLRRADCPGDRRAPQWGGRIKVR
jgi:hypothetical protein